ncbi:MAG: lysine--tRNA ligase [Halobacteriaceae archaeon]
MTADATHHAFWADDVADEIEARDPTDPIVVKGAVSPSGIPHIGHLNEIVRGYYVAAVLRDRGHDVRQVFTTDDRDALRKIPRRLADADWNIVDLGSVDAAALGQNLGVPYSDIPDPFGDCHASYGDHFTALLAEAAASLDIPVDVVATTDLYESGAFDDAVAEILANADQARAILARHQDHVDADYVPFMPNCESCGRQLTTQVTDVDTGAETVHYECVDVTVGDQEIAGCGHRGTAGYRDGKLPWRFEWPAGWQVLDVDHEPFGKDHAEGSWPSGVDIAEELLGIQPPVPLVYEWFTVDGQALSSSSGVVVTVPELLELVEPEVLRYFFAKDPNKQRDLDLTHVDQLVDEFDRFERRYFGDADGTDHELAFAERAYPFVVETVDADRVRIPYRFAAVLGMVEDRELQVQMAEHEGHLPTDAAPAVLDAALARVDRARRWARREDNAYNYELQATCPDVDLTAAEAAALEDLADFIETTHDGDAIQARFYELADAHDLAAGDLFEAGYRLFFDDTEGPRLGEFLGDLDREFVVDRLRREG